MRFNQNILDLDLTITPNSAGMADHMQTHRDQLRKALRSALPEKMTGGYTSCAIHNGQLDRVIDSLITRPDIARSVVGVLGDYYCNMTALHTTKTVREVREYEVEETVWSCCS